MSSVDASPRGAGGAARTGLSFPVGCMAIAGNAVRQLVSSGMTPLFQAAFLLALAMAVFLVGRVYHTDVTSLDLQWTFFPWVAAIFVPALAMQAFNDTPGDRRMELFASLPLSSGALVTGTWAAGVLVLIVTLAATFPFPATMAYLGNLDGGAAFSGYLGAAGFLAMAYAISLLAAAATRDPVGGYVVGAVALMTLELVGSDAGASLFRGTIAEPLIAHLPQLTPGFWLADMATGRIAMAGLVYMTVAVALALAATTFLIAQRRRAGSRPDRAHMIEHTVRAAGWIAGAGILLAGAIALDAGLDLTEEGEFTLHAETQAIARAAPPSTRIDYYWSRSNSDVPAAIRQHAARAERLLRRVAAQSGGRISIVHHDPAPDTEAEDEARLRGVENVALSAGGHFMLGASFSRGERQSAIAYLAPDRAPVMEYDIAATLAALSRTKTPRIGIISPLLAPTNVTNPREGLAMLEEIKRHYDVAIIPHFSESLPDGLDALFVIDATILKPEMLRSIDQHVMAGRGLVVLVDPFVRFNGGSNVVLPDPGEKINDISDLLLRYGLRFEGKNVVGDASLASTVGAGEERFLYPFWMRMRRPQFSPTHPLVAGLNELGFAEPGAFTLLAPGKAKALVTTSDQAGTLPRGAFKDGNPQELAARLKPGAGARIIAAAIEGKLNSAFGAGGSDRAGKTKMTSQARIFAVADVDWIFDPLTYTGGGSGEARILARPLNDNIAALSNMLEAAAGRTGLAGIRSRGLLARPFTRVTQMLSDAQEQYREKEAELLGRISRVEDNVRKVLELSGARSLSELPDDIQGKVQELRRALLPYRRDLRALRKTMREDVERLGWRLMVVNLLAGPLLAVLLFLFARTWRRRSVARMLG
jgi:gliding motility-associated transport system permease protein/gliding motility-associatede transport system auxiliary component